MALTERLQETTQVGFWTGEIPLEYIYTYGRAGEAYYRSIQNKGMFLGARCDRCGITYVPPRIYCEKCFDRLESKYVPVSTTGTVVTYTVLYKNLDGTRKKDPTIMAMINLDGAYGGVVYQLGEVRPEEVTIGMKVQAVFKTKRERKGGILDIKHFKPMT